MAQQQQQQQQQDFLGDSLCPPHKQYDVIDANKKFDLVNPQRPNESKILGNILINHPLCLSELLFSVDDLRRIFQLPKTSDNKNVGFVATPSFSQMLPFFQNDLGFSLPMRHDQPPFQIMQILYYFINNIHVDYAELLWEGIHYSYSHPTRLIPYPRFTKIIIGHYMTKNHEIPRRLHGHCHRVENDEVIKTIFNSGKNKEGKGMKIPDWMLTEEMKHTGHYKMYVTPR
ncbi:hypothetical protein Tco_0671592 [Tanacetum coccineum]